MSIKRGAMFGLDARIALAIFGALSVISGAALYSAIQGAKSERYRQEFIELNKAVEAYYLDVGEQLADVRFGNLVENVGAVKQWKGPYIQGTQYNSGISVNGALTDLIGAGSSLSIKLKKTSDWTIAAGDDCVIGDFDCSQYIVLYSGGTADGTVRLKNIFNSLDVLIDGTDGYLLGDVRYIVSSVNYERIYFKSLQRKRI